MSRHENADSLFSVERDVMSGVGNDIDDLMDDPNNPDDEQPDDEDESPFRDPPEGCVRLRPSQFQGIPSTIFIEYPPELGIRRTDVSVIEKLGARRLGYKSYWERVCIKNAHCRAGFVKSEKYWTSLWSKHQNAEQMKELNCLQKINHFPASWCIGRKDRLIRTLNTMKRIHSGGGVNSGSVFDFHPETFILPAERESLHRLLKTEISAAHTAHSSHRGKIPKTFNSSTANMSLAGGMWIQKPCASSCGQGIKVITGQQAMALSKKKKAIVQRYLAQPYLINGRKFDLRIYVLVSGVDPMRVYIHDEGLTRISTAKYTVKNLTNSYAHLTNYSINKKAPNFKAATFSGGDSGGGSARTGVAGANGAGVRVNNSMEGDDDEEERGDCELEEDLNIAADLEENGNDPEMEGFKWSLAAFRRWLAQREGKAVMEQTFDRIFDLCLKTMIAAESEITPHLHSHAQYRTNCFELFGCDVILDSALQPHLLEVNVSPSLMGSSPLDKKIKGMVIADILHIVGLYPHDPALLKKYDNSSNSNNSSSSNNNMALQKTASAKCSANTPAQSLGGNPFTFNSLSKLMHAQDRYRRSPSPENIDVSALGDNDCSWMLLLMAEDELGRARSSRFHCVHPTPSNAYYYCALYRSARFSDHLLANWVAHGGARGKYGKIIPSKFRSASHSQSPQQLGGKGLGSPYLIPTTPINNSNSKAVPILAVLTGGRVRAKSAGRMRIPTSFTATPSSGGAGGAGSRDKSLTHADGGGAAAGVDGERGRGVYKNAGGDDLFVYSKSQKASPRKSMTDPNATTVRTATTTGANSYYSKGRSVSLSPRPSADSPFPTSSRVITTTSAGAGVSAVVRDGESAALVAAPDNNKNNRNNNNQDFATRQVSRQHHRSRGLSEPRYSSTTTACSGSGIEDFSGSGKGSSSRPSPPRAGAGISSAPSSAMRARLEEGISAAAALYDNHSNHNNHNSHDNSPVVTSLSFKSLSGTNEKKMNLTPPAEIFGAKGIGDFDDDAGVESTDISSPCFRVKHLISECSSPYATQSSERSERINPNNDNCLKSADLTKRMLERVDSSSKLSSRNHPSRPSSAVASENLQIPHTGAFALSINPLYLNGQNSSRSSSSTMGKVTNSSNSYNNGPNNSHNNSHNTGYSNSGGCKKGVMKVDCCEKKNSRTLLFDGAGLGEKGLPGLRRASSSSNLLPSTPYPVTTNSVAAATISAKNSSNNNTGRIINSNKPATASASAGVSVSVNSSGAVGSTADSPLKHRKIINARDKGDVLMQCVQRTLQVT